MSRSGEIQNTNIKGLLLNDFVFKTILISSLDNCVQEREFSYLRTHEGHKTSFAANQ